jgi:hypothetical protein
MLTLRLDGWMCHKGLEIEMTAPVAFVVGANGAGKTAIRDALEFLYLGTGLLRGITTKKDLGALSITEGRDRCCVTLELELVKLSREMKSDGSQKLYRQQRVNPLSAWSEPEQVAPRRDGKSQIGAIASDLLRVILEPTAFLHLPPERRREMLIGATSTASTEEEILAALQSGLQTETPEDEAALATAAGWAADQGFRYAEEQAGETRRRAKRELGEIDPTEPEDVQAYRDHDLATYEARLEEVRHLHLRAVEAEATSVAVLEGRFHEAKAAQMEAEAGTSGRLDGDAAPALKVAIGVTEEALVAAEAASADVAAVGSKLGELRSTETAEPGEFQRPGKCPAIDFEMSCPVKTATFVKHRVGARRDGPVDLDNQIGEQEQLQKIALQAHQEAVGRLEAARSSQTDAADRAHQAQAAETAQATAKATLETARTRVQEIEGQLLEAREASQQAQGESAADLAERVQKGVEMVSSKRTWDALAKVYQEAVADQARLQAQVARWDSIAKALKPDGVEVVLGGGARQRFLEMVAEAAGISGIVNLTPTFDLRIVRGGSVLHPLQLSTSQQLAVGVAIQHAMARLIEFPILICDALDTFDLAQRRAWAAFAQAVSSDYAGGVIGIATLADPPATTPPAGFETFWLHDGGAEHLGGAS